MNTATRRLAVHVREPDGKCYFIDKDGNRIVVTQAEYNALLKRKLGEMK